MSLRLLALALSGASAVSAAPVRPSSSISEARKITVVVTSTVTVQYSTPTFDASLQARQWEWPPSTPAWSEPAWTQPAWSASAVTYISDQPVWSSSMSHSYNAESTPAPTPTFSWTETHQPDPKVTQTAIITVVCVSAVLIGLGLISFLITMLRRRLRKRAPQPPPQNASDVQVDATACRNSQDSDSSTPTEPSADSNTKTRDGFHVTPTHGHGLAGTPRLTVPLDGVARGLRRSSSLYQNNIPPQETHWPPEEMEQYTTWTRGTGYYGP